MSVAMMDVECRGEGGSVGLGGRRGRGARVGEGMVRVGWGERVREDGGR